MQGSATSRRGASPDARVPSCGYGMASGMIRTCSGCTADLAREPLMRVLGDMQPEAGAAPQHVLDRTGPFVVYQIVDFARGQAGTEILAEAGKRGGVADAAERKRAVVPGQPVRQDIAEERPLETQAGQEPLETALAQIAARQHTARGPCLACFLQERMQLFHRVFGET